MSAVLDRPGADPVGRRRSGPTRRWWVALCVGVVVVAVGATVLLTARRLPPSFSAAPVTVPPASTAAAATSSAPVMPSSAPATAAVTEAFVPTSVSLTAFGVTAAVDPAFTAGGVLQPPEDPARLGWWAAGQLAAAKSGSTVIVGHVDGPRGPGALYRLVHARPGDRVTVAGSNGSRITYGVTSLQYHGKGNPLPASLFATAGPPRLVLISCGGTFDRSDDQYEDNVVVQAAPV